MPLWWEQINLLDLSPPAMCGTVGRSYTRPAIVTAGGFGISYKHASPEEKFLLSNWPVSPFLGHSTMPPTTKCSRKEESFLFYVKIDLNSARQGKK